MNATIDLKELHQYIPCDACDKPNPPLKCSRCHTVFYCDKDCQRDHWKVHKPDCRPLEKMRAEVAGVGDVLPSDRLTIEDAINKECCICLEPIATNPIVLPECRHAFCFDCLTRWQAFGKSSKNKCPYCRSQIETGVEEDALERAKLYAARAGTRNTPNYDEEESKRLYTKAVEELDKILAVDDKNCTLLFLKAQIVKHINPEEGLQVMEKIICLDKVGYENSLMIDGLLEQAQAEAAYGNMEEHDRIMDQLEKDMENQKFSLQRFPGTGLARELPLRLQHADVHQKAENWEDAKHIYLDLLGDERFFDSSSAPQQREVFTGIALCAFELKRYDKAESGATAALEMNRHFPGIHALLAKTQRAQGKEETALETMSRGALYEAPWDDAVRKENMTRLMKLRDGEDFD